MVTTDTGAKKIANNDNWRNIFDAHNDSVDAYDDHIAKLDSGLAYVAVQSGNDWMLPSGKNASSGDYVIVNKVFGHATATLTGGSTAIVENTNWVAESAGALNSLNNKIPTKIRSFADSSVTIPANGSSSFTLPRDGVYLIVGMGEVTKSNSVAYIIGGYVTASRSRITKLTNEDAITIDGSSTSSFTFGISNNSSASVTLRIIQLN